MTDIDRPIDPHKASVVEFALANFEIRSLADLGACWGVNGGYLLHALELVDLERAVMVDGTITDLSRERGNQFPQVEFVEAPLGDQTTVDKVGKVDAAIMFDILLHQVDPDWPEFLERYSKNIDTLIIHNQGWRGDESVRFPDFTVDEYLQRVYQHDASTIQGWYDKHDEWHDQQQRPWRDVHNFWQWGITAKDLVGTLWDLGYALEAFENIGPFDPRFSEIEVLSIVAHKR
ncbi:MAG: hypothetical protein P8N02_03185 [Actinomycetota bacterium]|jgi:hypothetical protein|nr:hypothetical protein [Actinomycetota bacterium]